MIEASNIEHFLNPGNTYESQKFIEAADSTFRLVKNILEWGNSAQVDYEWPSRHIVLSDESEFSYWLLSFLILVLLEKLEEHI